MLGGFSHITNKIQENSMAGSYNHAVTKEGKLRVSGESMNIATESQGDAYETIEEMYGMIWLLAGRLARKFDSGTLEDRRAWVEHARQNYRDGIEIDSPGRQTAEEHAASMRRWYPEYYR